MSRTKDGFTNTSKDKKVDDEGHEDLLAKEDFNISHYNKWKKMYKSGTNPRKALKGTGLTTKDINLFLKIYNKRNR